MKDELKCGSDVTLRPVFPVGTLSSPPLTSVFFPWFTPLAFITLYSTLPCFCCFSPSPWPAKSLFSPNFTFFFLFPAVFPPSLPLHLFFHTASSSVTFHSPCYLLPFILTHHTFLSSCAWMAVFFLPLDYLSSFFSPLQLSGALPPSCFYSSSHFHYPFFIPLFIASPPTVADFIYVPHLWSNHP